MCPEATAPVGVLLDARGYPRPAQTLPEYRRGKPPKNKGKRYWPTPPSAEEVLALLSRCPPTPKGRRQRALMAVLWRTGMRIGEALALQEEDLDPAQGTILIRSGKGGKRRTVGLDSWGWVELRGWLDLRQAYPVGAVFCVVAGPTAGRAINDSDIRKEFRRLTEAAGLRKRISPHGLRHAFATETIEEDGINLNDVSRVLGHSSLLVTGVYLRSITDETIARKFAARRIPTVPIPHAK